MSPATKRYPDAIVTLKEARALLAYHARAIAQYDAGAQQQNHDLKFHEQSAAVCMLAICQLEKRSAAPELQAAMRMARSKLRKRSNSP